MTRPKTDGSELSQLATLVSGACTGDVKVFGVTHNSKTVQVDDLYVALLGANNHGIDFLDEAIANGAIAVASDSHGVEIAKQKGIPTIELSNPREDMAKLAAEVYGHPERKLTLTGVTGTNGKTTTTHILRSIFLDAKKHVGVEFWEPATGFHSYPIPGVLGLACSPQAHSRCCARGPELPASIFHTNCPRFRRRLWAKKAVQECRRYQFHV